jgi:selenocysteine lyase/cysteine desulfurase
LPALTAKADGFDVLTRINCRADQHIVQWNERLHAAGRRSIHPMNSYAGASVEPDWDKVRKSYPTQCPLLNLNNAGVGPSPLVVQEAVIEAYRFANGEPDVNMWQGLDYSRAETKTKLAALVDCDAPEIALNRNSTEGLCTAIFGIELEPADEVVLSEWDYPSTRHAWLRRMKREGIVVRPVDFGLLDDDEAVIAAYANAVTSRTKVMHLTHMLHWTGRVLPIERLCALARQCGVQTIVDAAQSFAQIPFSFRKIGCDFLATSLHKWLGAPFGTGMLIVNASRIHDTWPLLAPFESDPQGIEKFDHWNLGTYCSPLESAIAPAVDFHNSIGTARVHARLRELSLHWITQASDIHGFKMHTPLDSSNLGAVTLFSINGVSADAIQQRLRDDHGISVRLRQQGTLTGVRVSPHLYTRKSELDRFVEALRQVGHTAQ